MAGLLTDEPLPRAQPGKWAAWLPTGAIVQEIEPPSFVSDRSFEDVITSRKSSVGGPVTWKQIEALLWHACRTLEFKGVGRADIPTEHRLSPSAGGLHSVSVVCQMSEIDEPPRAYLHTRHAVAVLNASPAAFELNRSQIGGALGATAGCTLRMIADLQKIDAAYTNGESLLWRDAGVVSATLCYVAEWMGLQTNIVGIVGSGVLPLMGYPSDRFMAVGAVHVSAPTAAFA